MKNKAIKGMKNFMINEMKFLSKWSKQTLDNLKEKRKKSRGDDELLFS